MSKKLTLDDFLRRARAAHGDRYDYRDVRFRGRLVPVTIVCPEHGPFQQLPGNHFRGHGCPQCAWAVHRKPGLRDIGRDLTLTAQIGLRIREARLSQQLSFSELAERTETLSKSRINNYEQGIRRLSIEAARELAAALGTVTAAWLLCVDEGPALSTEEWRLVLRLRKEKDKAEPVQEKS